MAEASTWEYAIMIWDGDAPDNHRTVRFSHRQALFPVTPGTYMETLRDLGDEGFELITHQFLVRQVYDRGGAYAESIRELLTFKRPLGE